MKKILTFVALLLVTVLPFIPTSTHACSCIPPQSPEVSLGQAAAVFSGTVTDINEEGILNMPRLEVTLDVDRVWKGSIDETVTVITAKDSAACGIPFAEGSTYIVYASAAEEGSNELRAYSCGRTALLEDATEDTMALGSGKEPNAGENVPVIAPASGNEEPEFVNGGHGAGLAVLLVALAALGGMIFAMTKQPKK
jgi:hypothetical protein